MASNLELEFSKYHGTGNDFILIDNRDGKFSEVRENELKKMCDRRFGIGADGVIVLAPHSTLDFEMVNYNADGSLSSFCGNGARTLIQLARDLGIKKSEYHFQASDGEHIARFENNLIHLKMKNVTEVSHTSHGAFLNTGSPHLVCIRENISFVDVKVEGARLRYHAEFAPKGTNVNFVEKIPHSESRVIPIRTYERGVEDETLSCGTGVIAAALVYEKRAPGLYELEFSAPGGHLKVKFNHKSESHFEDIWLVGPAVKTFEGKFNGRAHLSVSQLR